MKHHVKVDEKGEDKILCDHTKQAKNEWYVNTTWLVNFQCMFYIAYTIKSTTGFESPGGLCNYEMYVLFVDGSIYSISTMDQVTHSLLVNY